MAALRNPKHELVAQALAAGNNQTKSLLLGGYSKNSASKNGSNIMKANPGIRQRSEEILAARNAIEDRMAAQAGERKGYDKAFVRLGLQDVYTRCMQAEPVVVKGVPTGTYEFDPANALRALEDMGKDLAMFVERKEIGPPGAFASIEERREAERLLKLKMIKLGMARPMRLVGSSSAATVENSTPVDCRDSDTKTIVDIPTPEIEAPDQTGDSEPEAPSTLAERDLAPLPPGILEPIKDQPDPASVERLKPVPAVATQAVQAVQKVPGWGRKPYEPPVPRPPLGPDPGPGPERGAWRDEMRRRANLDVRDGAPNTRDRHGHPLKDKP